MALSVLMRRRCSARWVIALAILTASLLVGGAAYARVCERVVPSVDAPPPSLLIVMDASKSMSKPAGGGGTRLQAAKAALRTLVKGLPDGTRVGLRLYGHRVSGATRAEGCRDTELVSPVGELDRSALAAKIDSYEAVGFTPIGRALRAAAADLPTEGSASIVLVSDGGDNCAPPSPCAVAGQIAAGGQDVSVQAVGFHVNGSARAQLRCIAKRGGGVYRDASNADELAVVLRALAARATRTIEPGGKRVTGGARSSSARPIAPGRFSDEIGLGEERWYRVAAGRGQQIAASATLLTPCPVEMSVADAIGTSLTLSVVDGVSTAQPDALDATANLFATDTTVESVGLLTPVIGAPSGVGGKDPGSSSRLLHVVLDAAPRSGLAHALGSEPLALQLDVDVIGRARADTADGGDGSGFGVGVLVVVLLGAVLVGVIAGSAAGARRGRGAS
jgi:Ca-activated chloride channel family protein